MKEYWGKERKPISCPFPQTPIPTIVVLVCQCAGWKTFVTKINSYNTLVPS